jgi:hypothetical protein
MLLTRRVEKMLRRTRTTLALILLAIAGALTAESALAITVETLVSQQDRSLQAKELEEATNNVLNPIQKNLRSAIDAQGNPKTEPQKRMDRERADRILDIMQHIDHKKMAAMIMDANDRQPTVDLEKVIIAYILQELQKETADSQQTCSP